jgi:Carboxypeptidase regulatory-like domain
MRRILVAGFAVALLVAPAASATTSTSGVRGVVRRGPITPVCVAELPCDGPARGVTLRFLRDGNVVARTKTNAKGHYGVRLAPGRYVVRITGRVSLEPAEATAVRVRAGHFTRLDLHLDTGIR